VKKKKKKTKSTLSNNHNQTNYLLPNSNVEGSCVETVWENGENCDFFSKGFGW